MEFLNIGCGGNHDLGGMLDLENNGLIDVADHPLAYWEISIHALLVFLACQKPAMITTDELRRAVEGLEKGAYRTWGYYDRWAVAITTILLERGVISQQELDFELFGDEKKDKEQLFQVGDYVQVKAEDTRLRWRRPHLRCPGYIYGLIGKITKFNGTVDDPYFLAYRSDGPKQPLYSMIFPMKYIWHTGNVDAIPDMISNIISTDFDGDCIEADIFQEWLSPFDITTSSRNVPKTQDHDHDHDHHEHHEHSHHHDHAADTEEHGTTCCDDHHDHEETTPPTEEEHTPAHSHEHEHGHSHLSRDEIEYNAFLKELQCPPAATATTTTPNDTPPGEIIAKAVLRLLIHTKHILPPVALQQIIEKLEKNTAEMKGKDLVAHAWKDAAFAARLVSNGDAAGKEYGIITTNPNAPTILRVVANTPTIHHVLVCTLCSCYPSALLGLSPSWYKSRNYRARVVREPRKVLAEFGLVLPQQVSIQVHDSTADCRYLVIPMPPPSLSETQIQTMSIEELKAYITRDAMIGVAVL